MKPASTVLLVLAMALAGLVAARPACAQTAAAKPLEGHEVLATKCFQCHTDSMWRDQRQSRRAWEATLYRMIGRGALWEPEEVRVMADYLGHDFGPDAPRAKSTPTDKSNPPTK